MLVHVGKLLQYPEGVRHELILSVVRLQLLDSCLRVWVNAPDFVAAFPLIHCPVAKDGELQNPGASLRQGVDAHVSEGEFVDKVVKSRPEVVEAVADNEAELGGRRLDESNLDELLVALTVDFHDIVVRVMRSPLTDLRI